jgi:hypothetical protein
MIKLYDKLESVNLVHDYKDFVDLIRIRAIVVNDLPVVDPKYIITENDKIKVGIKVLN